MVRCVEALTLPTSLKSFSPDQPSGRTGRVRETSVAVVILSLVGATMKTCGADGRGEKSTSRREGELFFLACSRILVLGTRPTALDSPPLFGYQLVTRQGCLSLNFSHANHNPEESIPPIIYYSSNAIGVSTIYQTRPASPSRPNHTVNTHGVTLRHPKRRRSTFTLFLSTWARSRTEPRPIDQRGFLRRRTGTESSSAASEGASPPP